MKRETRYLVLKHKDLIEYLDEDDRDFLAEIATRVALRRESDGKAPLDCVVVESDWPEFNETWDAIERRVDGKTAKIPVDHKQLFTVLRALNGPGHLIRELQFTRGPIVGDDNPINQLIQAFNEWVDSRKGGRL